MSRRPSRRARAAAFVISALPALGGCTADTRSPATSPVAAASPLATVTAGQAKSPKRARTASRTPRVITTSGARAADGEAAALALPGPPVKPVPPVGTRAMKPSATPSYRAGCGPLFQPGMLPIRVEASTTPRGDLVLTWMHPNDPSGVRYFVGVQPQVWVRAADGDLTKPEITWEPVDVPDLCKAASYTVPGARRGLTYSIWVEVEARTPEFGEATRIPVARLTGVTLD